MVITTTKAAALAAGSAVSGFDADQRPEALFLLTVLAGIVMIAAGLLRLGRYTRFVSHSVMTRVPDRRGGQHHLRPARRPDRR